VFSFAGQTSHLDSIIDPYSDLEHNCRAAITVLEACKNRAPEARVVFAGTRQIYGRPKYLPVDEQHPIQPVDINGIHKVAGEAYHVLYNKLFGMDTVIVRLTNTFGPRMRVRDARQTFLGLWIRLLLESRPLEVYGDGKQLRDFTYVDDALRAFLLCATRPEARGRIFNLGASPAISLLDLAQLMVRMHGRGEVRLIPFPKDREAIDIGDYQGDFSRIRDALGWEPLVRLEEGLRSTLEYYMQNGPRYWTSSP
jgi:UDP-glucose 4-epimerase